MNEGVSDGRKVKKMTQKTFRIIVIFLSLFLSISFLISCQNKKSGTAPKEATLVEIVPVRQGDIFKEIRFTGSIEAQTEVKVFPKVTAKIEAMKFDLGNQVKKDDLIALLESEDLRAQVAQAEAALQGIRAKWAQMEVGTRSEEIAQAEDLVAKASANLKDAENNYDRLKKLFDQGVIAKREFDSAELAHTVAKADFNSAKERLNMLKEGATKEDRQALKAQVRQAEASLELARIRLSYTRITSPISGTISQRFVDPGNLAVPTQPLVTIVQMDSVKVIVYFPENQIRFMVPGTEAKLLVVTYPDHIFHGTIDKVSPTLDPTTRMFSAEIKVVNEKHLLRPGMFTTVTLSVDPHLNALLVPKEAVFYTEEYQENPNSNQGGVSQTKYIFVVKEDKAHRRKVSLGHESGHLVEVLEGVEKGEDVVVRGLHQLNDGAQITVVKREEVEK
jgi:RND family efflux transporter MFP subunit